MYRYKRVVQYSIVHQSDNASHEAFVKLREGWMCVRLAYRSEMIRIFLNY
jgi:hypothetical protein